MLLGKLLGLCSLSVLDPLHGALLALEAFAAMREILAVPALAASPQPTTTQQKIIAAQPDNEGAPMASFAVEP